MKEFKKDKLTVKVMETRTEMGRVAAQDIHDRILELLEEKDEINMIFAAAPSQNDVLKSLTECTDIPWNRIIPNRSFPDMKGLTDYIHSFGFKAGLYSSPGPVTCGQCEGSYRHELQDAESWSDWGFDYVKDLWRQKCEGRHSGFYAVTVPPHATKLVKMRPVDCRKCE